MVPLQGSSVRGWWGERCAPLVPFLLSLLLVFFLSPRPELGGVCLGLLILGLPIPHRGILQWAQGFAAIGAAALFGFRIPFLTDPAGGVLGLGSFSIPFTLLWGTAVLGLREGLRAVVPRPALQLSIDLLLVGDALLLVLVFPQAQGVPLARALPFLLLVIVLWGAFFVRGRRLLTVHRSVAFGLVLYGISGMTKGAVSLFLVAPLAMIGLPMMTVSPAFLASGAPSVRPVPHLFARWRITQDAFVLSFLVLASAFVLGGVLAAYHSAAAALLALLVLPVLFAAHRGWPHVVQWLSRARVERRLGRVRLFGVSFHSVDLSSAAVEVGRMLTDRSHSHVVVTPNSLSVLRARRDPVLSSAYERADLVLADGIGIVWASRLLGVPLPERVTGVDLAEAILPVAARAGTRVFLLGGRPGVAERAGLRLVARFPDLSIVGMHDGYFTDEEGVRRVLEEARPELLLVGMGVPQQERFMACTAGTLRIPVMVGLGGGLDLFAGDRVRAPQAWRRLGLEWLYRITQEPRRAAAVWGILRFIIRACGARIILTVLDLLSLPAEA